MTPGERGPVGDGPGEDGGFGQAPRDEPDPILERILDDLELGLPPDAERLRAEFPDRASEVERLCEAASHYRTQTEALREPPAARDILPPPLGRGSRVGDFEIVAPLGRGGMGWVYRAQQLSLGGRTVALKVLPAAEDSEVPTRHLRREALVASSLHHPNLAEGYGFGVADGVVWYAMRLVEGPSLRDALERVAAEPRLLDQGELRRHLVQRVVEVASALAACHRAGFVHGDVKPSNVLLEWRDGDARLRRGERAPGDPRELSRQVSVLVDFGLARTLDPEARTRWGGTSATPAYAAPELLLGEEIDARTDVFSLGVTLHDLLSGTRPADRLQASAGLEPLERLVPDIDPDLAAIVAHATDPMPRWRYADGSELRADLEAWLDDRPVRARRAGLAERTQRFLRRSPGRLVRGGAAALLVAALLWVGFSGGEVLARARDARASVVHGEPRQALPLLRELPAWAANRGLFGAELAEARRALSANGAATPEAELWQLLEQGEESRALLQAATHLERDGLVARDLHARHLLGALVADTAAGPAAQPSGEPRALLLTARLFAERPDRSAEDSLASAGFRAALVELLEAHDGDLPCALLALTALGGCGTPAELDAILGWLESGACSADHLSEPRRLALRTSERIVRRAHACGTALGPPGAVPAALVPRWRRLAEDCARQSSGFADPVPGAWTELLRALVILGRARGEVLDLAWFPRGMIEADAWADLEVAADGAHDAARLEARARDLLERRDWRRLGWTCGMGGARASTDAWRERAALAGGEDAPRVLRELDAGREEAQHELGGLRPVYDLDADSHLGDRSLPAVWTEIPLARVPEPPGAPEPIVAEWRFQTDPGRVTGWATSAESYLVRRTTPRADMTLVTMPVFGRSAVRLTFDLPPDEAHEFLALGIQHLRASRVYMPFNGQASIEVELDGAPLEAERGVHRSGFADDFVRLPVEALGAGRHAVTIRLAASTTTTYRISRVWLTPVNPLRRDDLRDEDTLATPR